MYTKAGGKGCNIAIYYSPPGHTLDSGIKILEGDGGIRDLIRDYKGLNVISIYIKEKPGPILAMDGQGNILKNDEQLPQLEVDFNQQGIGECEETEIRDEGNENRDEGVGEREEPEIRDEGVGEREEPEIRDEGIGEREESKIR
ncbi:hypothetical protein Salat_0891200 [Sesamum alatum]|uniref:Uncharacterized protein n=1 Tax=Sesamum alatum TaxID=300844 RepID=A0AAE1YJD9_9LAMI|nr:hypothetical protein Salat_0891200 [Sesamum alatum]